MLAEDWDVFYNVSEFATVATYNGSRALKGMYDPNYIDPLGVAEGMSEVFFTAEQWVPDVKYGDTLAFDGRSYKVTNVQGRRSGNLMLQLEEQ